MKRWINKTIIGLFNSFGYQLTHNWRVKNLTLATHLQQLFKDRSIECVLDVGANTGQYGTFLRHNVGFKGLILSFEPNPGIFAQLEQTTANDPLWRVFNLGLADKNGSLTLNVTKDTQFTSFLSPDHTSGLFRDINRTEHQIEVPVIRLDKFLSEQESVPDRLYMKLDTQGFDLSVFAGATGILDRTIAMQSEMSVIPIYAAMPDYHQALAHYTQAGFELSGMFPISVTKDHRLIEFDAVMCRPAT
jgi:FkbM family methyltransferase